MHSSGMHIEDVMDAIAPMCAAREFYHFRPSCVHGEQLPNPQQICSLGALWVDGHLLQSCKQMTCTYLEDVAWALYTAALRNEQRIQHLRRISVTGYPRIRIAVTRHDALPCSPARKLR